MDRNMKLLTRGLAGVLCFGLLSACGDRMGAFKANRISCDKYNDWARKNNQPLRCGAGIANKPVVKSDSGNVLEDLQPNVPSQVSPADQPKNVIGDSKPSEDQTVKDSGPQDTVTAESKVVNSSEQHLSGPYKKTEWSEQFEGLLKSKDKTAVELVKGITVNSGKAENGKDILFDFQAVVKFNGQNMYLFSKPVSQAVRFDKDTVMPVQIEVRKSVTDKSAKAEALSNDLIVSATCLADESPCSRFGLVLDFKMAKGDRAWAVFEITSSQEGMKKTGITDSNLKEELKNFDEGQKSMSAEAAPSQIKVTVDEGKKTDQAAKEPTDADFLKGAQSAASVVSKKRNAAEDAYQAADAAHKAGDSAKAEEQAKLAEASAKEAEEANKIVADWMGQLKAKTTDAKKIADADAVIAFSSKQVEEANGFANGARINANYAQASNDSKAKTATTSTASAEAKPEVTQPVDDEGDSVEGEGGQP